MGGGAVMEVGSAGACEHGIAGGNIFDADDDDGPELELSTTPEEADA